MYNLLIAEREYRQSTSSQPGLLNNERLGGQAGLATYVAAKIFGSAPLPPGTPDWLQASVESQANFAQRLPSTVEMTIGGAGGGSLGMKTKAERQQDADAEAIETMTVRLEQVERERRQWAEQRHEIAGVEMTGAEWSNLAERLRSDEDLKQRVLDAFRRRGMSEEEAERRFDRVADVSEIMAIPEAQRSEEQAATVAKAEADPSFKKDIQTVQAELDHKSAATPSTLRQSSPIAETPLADTAAAKPVTILAGPAF